MKENYDGNVDKITGDAYKNLNKEYVDLPDVEFDEPLDITFTSEKFNKDDKKIDSIVEDIGESTYSKRKEQILLGLALVILIAFLVVFFRTSKLNKTIEFTENGISNIELWNKFKEECKDNKKTSINIHIVKKDQVKSKTKLIFDGKEYTYGKGKSYKYLLDETGEIDDLGLDLRCIVLSDQKYDFNQIYMGMSDNVDVENREMVLSNIKESVDSLSNTLDELGKDISEEEDDDDAFFKNSEEKEEVEEDIVYQFIYCY